MLVFLKYEYIPPTMQSTVLTRISTLERQLARMQRLFASLVLNDDDTFYDTVPRAPPPSPVRVAVAVPPGRPRVVFFDFETGGACRATDKTKIKEIGAVPWGRDKNPPTWDPMTAPWRIAPFRHRITEQGPASWAGGMAELFNQWLGPDAVLAGFNSKRYDARILTFEHARVPAGGELGASLSLPPRTKFVDLMEVFRVLCPSVGVPRTLGAYHTKLTGENIVSPHTALADADALRACMDALVASKGEEAVWEAVTGAWETAHAVEKRCGL
jgi:hypothetical protein